MTESFVTPDVRQLREQDLSNSSFPAGRGQDFRVAIDADVHARVGNHAAEDLSREICGVLVGQWCRDEDGPYVRISESVRADAANSQFAEVTFTHESWAQIHHEMDTRFSHLKIVGWYHSHPDFGVFLSDQDRFIQQHFFSAPGQIAYVVDPVRQLEGVFVWQEGKPAACPHYWVGDRVCTKESAQQTNPAHAPESSAPGPSAVAAAENIEWLPRPRTVLICLAVFLMGFWLAGLRNSWERRTLAQGAVAHYGLWRGLRPGLRDSLTELDAQLDALAKDLTVLSTHQSAETAEEAKKIDAWRTVASRVSTSRRLVGAIKAVYCLSRDEETVVARLLAAKLSELSGAQGVQTDGPSEKVTDTKGARNGAVDRAPSDKETTHGVQSNQKTQTSTQTTAPDGKESHSTRQESSAREGPAEREKAKGGPGPMK